MIEILGLVAGFSTVVAFIPRIVKSFKTKSTKDISLGMFAILCTSATLWLIYGLLADGISIVITNGILLILVIINLYLKIKYDKR